jgi:hypothetical protein
MQVPEHGRHQRERRRRPDVVSPRRPSLASGRGSKAPAGQPRQPAASAASIAGLAASASAELGTPGQIGPAPPIGAGGPDTPVPRAKLWPRPPPAGVRPADRCRRALQRRAASSRAAEPSGGGRSGQPPASVGRGGQSVSDRAPGRASCEALPTILHSGNVAAYPHRRPLAGDEALRCGRAGRPRRRPIRCLDRVVDLRRAGRVPAGRATLRQPGADPSTGSGADCRPRRSPRGDLAAGEEGRPRHRATHVRAASHLAPQRRLADEFCRRTRVQSAGGGPPDRARGRPVI